MSLKNLQIFIKEFLALGGVKEEWLEKLTTNESLFEFQKALTHSSVDRVNNYEVFELFGDVIVNHSTLMWSKSRFPYLTNIEWITKIKHMLISTRYLAQIAEKSGISNFARINLPKIKTNKKTDLDENIKYNEEYAKIIEDCVESLFGCISFEMEKRGLRHGIAHEICQNIIFHYFDEIFLSDYDKEQLKLDPENYVAKFPFTYENTWDAVTRLKEIHDSMKWPFGFIEHKNPDETTTLELRAWINYRPTDTNNQLTQNVVKLLFEKYSFSRKGITPQIISKEFTNGIVITKEMVEYISEKLYNKLGRLEYNKTQRDFSNKPNQFVSYFGKGETIAKGTFTRFDLQKGKMLVAEKAIQVLRNLNLKYKDPPPLTYQYKEKKVGNFNEEEN